jgi:uncharacterized membrane protein YbaN (DUF454 family)
MRNRPNRPPRFVRVRRQWPSAPESRRRGIARVLLVAGGTLCVAVGIAGVFLPVLPTTPFLLLAAICYARSSARFYRWLLTNRWCGEYIRNYREGRGITLKHKLLTAALLWLTIGYAVGFAVPRWWAKVILLGIAVGVTVHLVRIKTYRREASRSRLAAPEGSPEESG